MSFLPIYNDKALVYAWTYCNSTGEIIGYIARYQNGSDKKDIVPFFKREGDSFTVGGVPTENRSLYGLEQLSVCEKRTPIFVLEGEKSTQAMRNLGFIAITSLGGSNAAIDFQINNFQKV
jgi:hypothetical protein